MTHTFYILFFFWKHGNLSWEAFVCVCSHKVLLSFLTDQRMAEFLCVGNYDRDG